MIYLKYVEQGMLLGSIRFGFFSFGLLLLFSNCLIWRTVLPRSIIVLLETQPYAVSKQTEVVQNFVDVFSSSYLYYIHLVLRFYWMIYFI